MAEGEGHASQPSRRRLLINGIKALGALFALALGVPLAGFFFSPAGRRDKREEWISLARLSELKDSRPTKVTYQYARKDGWTSVATRKMAFILRGDDGALTVLSNRCSHLGCGVDWDATAGHFKCPCHGGVFDAQGRVMAGPPPRALTRLVSKVEDGTVFIREA
jgi:Rieske Fe-S protein